MRYRMLIRASRNDTDLDGPFLAEINSDSLEFLEYVYYYIWASKGVYYQLGERLDDVNFKHLEFPPKEWVK